MNSGITESLRAFSDTILDSVKANKSIMLTTHMDCDGLVSGAIMANALARINAKFTVHAVKELDSTSIARLRGSNRDLHVIMDLGAGSAKELDDALGERWLVLDHHKIPDNERDSAQVFNAWKYDIDGGSEICTGGMAYVASTCLDDVNEDLSVLAVVAALGDRQDRGDKRSLIGKNKAISEQAQSLGLLEIGQNLLLTGRETKPLVDALASTSSPFINGLTWNKKMCSNVLDDAGVQQKEGDRWRMASELSKDEIRSVADAIAKFAAGSSSADAIGDLVGYVYTLPRESRQSLLRDGREFATMLNSCARMGRPSIGVAICMGDRRRAPAEGATVLTEYQGVIHDHMNMLTNERWRIAKRPHHIVVNAGGVVTESMAGAICSLFADSSKYSSKVVILSTDGERGAIKISSRRSPGCKLDIDLGGLIHEAAEIASGRGGGHDTTAGATISKDKMDEFLDFLEERFAKLQSEDRDK